MGVLDMDVERSQMLLLDANDLIANTRHVEQMNLQQPNNTWFIQNAESHIRSTNLQRKRTIKLRSSDLH